MKFKNRLIIAILIIALIGVCAIILSQTSPKKLLTGNPEIFSKENMLQSLWYHYKKDHLEEGTLRVLDKDRNNVTTSEGESYALLRSVWMNDKSTFDTSWQWTKDNLQHTDDHLLSWLFGKRSDGSYGVLTEEGGNHSAADADVDTALALIFASYRWNDDRYMGDALLLLEDIWEKEVVQIGDKNYLVANDIEKEKTQKVAYILNPSYFAPYAFRIFAQVDPKHDWLSLVDSSYEVLYANLDSSLDAGGTAHLPSDWVTIDSQEGTLNRVASSGQTTDFSFDAMRIPWKLALDIEWFDEPRAKEILTKMSFLRDTYTRTGSLDYRYNHRGDVVEKGESPAFYGGTIGYFMITDPTLAREVYLKELESLYNPDTFNWKKPLGYYDANWAWFGMALYNHMLPNLSIR